MGVAIEHLRRHETKLMGRLNDGEAKIAAARQQGDPPDVLARWEQGWIDLLRQYEQVHDEVLTIGS